MNNDHDKPEPGGKSAPRLTGALEGWTYGAGAAYAVQDVPLAQARFAPAIVALPPGAAITDLVDKPGKGQGRVLLPLLWRGLERQTRAGSVWPVVIDFGNPRLRAPLSPPLVNRTLAALSERAVVTTGEATPVYTLSRPVPTGTVFAGRGRASAATADPAKARRLSRKRGTGRQPVVMAVIDDGIPFAHRNLLNRAGDRTRVAYVWHQDVAADGTLLLGREFTGADIDQLRADCGPDEDAIYARAGVLQNSPDYSATLGHFASHGAHVIDAAAGWRDDGIDLDHMHIVAVQLPLAMTLDPTTNGRDGVLLAALHYIFERADDIAEAQLGSRSAPLPLVVNFSYGFSGGPHDGSDTLERAMALMVATRKAQNKPTELVMPASNTFATCMHGEIAPGSLRPGRSFDIPWRLQPSDQTSSYLDIWLPAASTATSYRLAMTDPLGRQALQAAGLAFQVGPGAPSSAANLVINGQIIGRIDVTTHDARWSCARIAVAPTEPRNMALPASPVGLWSLSLTRTGGAAPPRPVACHIQRDSERFGYNHGGRQSYFDDPLDQRYTADGARSRIENAPGTFVRRYGTVNGLATHDQVTVVSSHYADTGRATEYASAGSLAVTTGSPGSVQVSMAADRSTALRGVISAGTRSGAVLRLSGTSMAAPLHARVLAARFIDPTWPLPPVQPLMVEVSAAERAERPVRLGVALAV